MTILPPPNGDCAADTVPPERARESSLPPAMLDVPTLAIQLDALRAAVDEIRGETLGTSAALANIARQLSAIMESIARTEANIEILKNDARQQRRERIQMRADLDELELRVSNVVEEES